MAEEGDSRGRRQDGGKGRTRMKVPLNGGGILVVLGGLMATAILSSVFRRRRKPVDEVDYTPEEDGGAEADSIGEGENLPNTLAQLVPPDSSPLTHHQEPVNLRDNQTSMQGSDDEELESPASGVHATIIPEDQEGPPNATGDLNETKLDLSVSKEEMEITCSVDNNDDDDVDDDQKKYTYPAVLDDLTTNNVVKTQDLEFIHDPKDGLAIPGQMRQSHDVKEEDEEEDEEEEEIHILHVSASKEEMEITCCVDNNDDDDDDDDDDNQKKYAYYPAVLDDLTDNNGAKTQDLDSIHDLKDGVAIPGQMRLQGHNVFKEEEEEEEMIMEAINGGDKQQKNDCDGHMKMKDYILDRVFATTFRSERRMAIAGFVALIAVTCSCFSCLFGMSLFKYCMVLLLLPWLAFMASLSNFNHYS